ncbi:RsmD family RNA methyltransferase [Spirochaeta africana]|uniref:N6-adenine-specific methylase n=1 Tax=Spirochaeta africana (strain ATCC 700263 / DSM 8902 / Z-7692) TaxID=889378 RepID=H9UL71_SPIAZ|nr:RsmD family RNA methyltransferase [Spirochaeta africana]AFG38264.1 N6-adenine-specific methylase [Spirochaeta africana DSM 8902]
MRITSGSYRGRRIACPPGVIRPAMDRMRESLFSALGPIEGLSFLDLFSGSGVMGLEAASRGAAGIRLVEKDIGKKRVMLQNIAIADQDIRISFMPVERFIRSWKEHFDIIYLDPPFDYRYKLQLLENLLSSRLLTPTTRILIHYPREDNLPDRIKPAARISGTVAASSTNAVGSPAIVANAAGADGLIRTDRREYGRSWVGWYVPENSSPA